jgi:hypothetical protein
VPATANQTISGNAQNGASLSMTDLGFSDPNGCPLTGNWTGSCGSGSGATVNCPFGASNLSLTATNNAVTLTPSASLQITVTSFKLAVSPAQASVAAGQSANFTITVAPQYGAFGSAVSLGCSGVPSEASCFFSSASVTPGSSQAASSLTVSTTAKTGFLTPSPRVPRDQKPVYAVLLKLGGMSLVGAALARTGLKRGRRRFFLPVIFVLAWLLVQMTCGGSGNPGTPRGTYNVTVTGTFGSLQQSSAVSLTVQ